MVLINQLNLVNKNKHFISKTITSMVGVFVVSSAGLADASPSSILSNQASIEEVRRLVETGAYTKARPLMHRLLTSHPEDIDYHLVAARMYKKMGLWSRAIIEYEWIRRKNPKLAEPYIALSEMYMENLSSELALSMAIEAHSLAPDSQEAVSQLIRALIANQEFRQAELELEALIAKFPHDGNVMHLAYILRRDLGDYKEAKKFLEKAIELKPEKIAWLLDLYSICMIEHDTASANRAIDLYIQKSPDSQEALLKKARLAETQLYDYKQARIAYEKVIELDSENWVAKAGLERISKKQSDVAETVKRAVRGFISSILNWIGSFFAKVQKTS